MVARVIAICEASMAIKGALPRVRDDSKGQRQCLISDYARNSIRGLNLCHISCLTLRKRISLILSRDT
jgi:ribosomal protein S14